MMRLNSLRLGGDRNVGLGGRLARFGRDLEGDRADGGGLRGAHGFLAPQLLEPRDLGLGRGALQLEKEVPNGSCR